MGGDGEKKNLRRRKERILEDLSWRERRVRWRLGESKKRGGEGRKGMNKNRGQMVEVR